LEITTTIKTIDPPVRLKPDELKQIVHLPGYTLFQHPRWMSITYPDYTQRLFVCCKEAEICGFALVVERMGTARVLFGPLVSEPSTAEGMLIYMAGYYRDSGYASLSCQLPYIKGSGDNIAVRLNAKGYKTTKPVILANWSTLLLDLDQLTDTTFSVNHRRSIRKALNSGISIKKISGKDDLLRFAEIFAQMYEKRKISMPFAHPAIIFEEIAEFFDTERTGIILGAYDCNNDLRGGAIMGMHNDRLFYHYGTSSSDPDKIPVLHAVFDEAIRFARTEGFSKFDFGGYSTLAGSGSQLSNINRFKEGFHGELVHYEDVIEMPLNPAKYKIMRSGIWLRRKIKNS
jgi:hypothetical protein